MFITQLLNRASSMMWAAIQKKKKKKKKKKNHNACSHASSGSLYMRFPHCTMDEIKKDKLAKD